MTNRDGMKDALSAGIACAFYTAILAGCARIAFYMAGIMPAVTHGFLTTIGFTMSAIAGLTFFYAAWGTMAGTIPAAWDYYANECAELERRETGIR